MPKDYGYFGKGIAGYTHYMQAFDRNNRGGKKPSGGKGGCLSVLMLLLLSGVLLFSLLIQ